MNPFRLDIRVRRNCHFSFQLQFMQTQTLPFDITGYSFQSQIRTADQTLVCAVTIAIVDAVNGIISGDIAQATTGAIDDDVLSGIWDVVGKPMSGEWSPMIEGNVIVYPGATVPT